MSPSPTLCRGFAAPLAVFIILLGLALAGGLAMLSGTQQSGIALDIQGVRAYQAARAGLEWGMHRVLRAGPPACAGVGPGGTSTFSPGGGLGDFQVTVTCIQSTHTEGGNSLTVHALIANACNVPTAGSCPNTSPGGPGTPGYVERELRVTVGSE